jgi:uncharacterized membrane protein
MCSTVEFSFFKEKDKNCILKKTVKIIEVKDSFLCSLLSFWKQEEQPSENENLLFWDLQIFDFFITTLKNQEI